MELYPDFIEQAILREIERRTREIIEEEATRACDAALKIIKHRLYSEVDHIALKLLSEYNIERNGPDLRITVRKVLS